MNLRTLLLLALAAFAASPGAFAQQACSNNCTITVEVTSDGKTCAIIAPRKNDEFHIARFATTDITWRLKAPQGFVFSEPDGIKFSPDPPANTFIRRPSSNRQEFTYNDKNDTPGKRGAHPYHIQVENGSITCRLDPSVVND